MSRREWGDRFVGATPREYAFVTRWRIDAEPSLVWAAIQSTLADPSPAMAWRGVTMRAEGDGRAGTTVTILVCSPFGYRLSTVAVIDAVEPGASMRAHAEGDLVGTGRVRILRAPGPTAVGSLVHIEWRVRATRRWMNEASVLLHPVFVSAHWLVMRNGRRALRRAVSRPAAHARRGGGSVG